MKTGLLLAGKAITTSNGIKIHPLTLGQIIEIGMNNYSYYMSMIQMKDEILKFLLKIDSEEELEKISNEKLKNLIVLITSSEEIGRDLLYFLQSIVRERVILHEYNLYVVDEDEKNIRLIDENIYSEISDILELQNCSKTVEEVEEYEDDPEIRAFTEKANRLNKIIDQANNNDSDATLDDLISSLSVANVGLNVLNIWDLTLYQFYNQLKRYGAKTNADLSIKSMLAGANDVEIKNWMGKLSNND